WAPMPRVEANAEVRFAPAVILRRRERASLIGYYDAMLQALRGNTAPAPLFPLPANPEQMRIMDRLRANNGVVVQGPPGTGKTHTIANLMSALLAEGQRVLVNSPKGQALRGVTG